ncbi:MAG TPA: LysM peptidoglycan-binding domain-containing protein [Anaerolineales bacterium]|nr:LysM peptidoglycan-binding domain-containing protein [Anaerolineales bacterium]
MMIGRRWRVGMIATMLIGGPLVAWGGGQPGALAANAAAFTTPTPGPDGKIIYIVQEGDDLWTIAALIGKSVEELMALNGIQPGDYITPGMELVLGSAGPVLPTAAPEARPTITLFPVTPTPVFGTGEICILLFLDVNGNARLDAGETALPGGQISIAEPSGVVAGEDTTSDDPAGRCFEGLLNGDYNVSAAAPQDHNPTTSMNIPLRLAPGEIKYIEFGAQASAALGGGVSASARSTVLGVIGIVLLLGAGGLAYFATRYGRRTPMSLR